jgi:hypothetical protein
MIDPDTNIIHISETLPGEAESLTISIPIYSPVPISLGYVFKGVLKPFQIQL